MQDWAGVFILLLLDVLFQIPGKCRFIEIGNYHTPLFYHHGRPNRCSVELRGNNGDWGPVLIAVLFFVLLMSGLLRQICGSHGRVVECRSMQTSAAAIVIHTVIFFAFCAIFMVVGEVHV